MPTRQASEPQPRRSRQPTAQGRATATILVVVLAVLIVLALTSLEHTPAASTGRFLQGPTSPTSIPLSDVLPPGSPNPCPTGTHPVGAQRDYGSAYVVCSGGLTVRP